ncbi:HEPN domain-containing protein [Hydrogenimonas sp.]
MNRTAACEWLRIAKHDLDAAKILWEAHHYTNTIGTLLQQSIEKTLKALLAYRNKKIPKTHDLVLLIYEVDLTCDDHDMTLMIRASEYYKEERYPNPNYALPTRQEIREVLSFAEKIFSSVSRSIKEDDTSR